MFIQSAIYFKLKPMKRYILIFICSQIFLMNLMAQEAVVIEGEKGEFEIKFIDEPAYKMDTIDLEGDNLITESWILSVDDESHLNSLYTFMKLTYPPKMFHSDSSLTSLESVINSSVDWLYEDKSNELLSATTISKNKYYGKEFRWKNRETNVFMTFDVYVVENILYVLQVTSRPNQNHNVYIGEFFDSFVLSDELQGKFTMDEKEYIPSYEITFPKKPTLSKQLIDSEAGKLEVNMQILENESNAINGFFLSGETSYPDDFLPDRNHLELNTFYINSVNGSLNAMNGQLITLENVYYKDNLGKEFRCYVMEGAVLLVYRIFLIENKAYSLGVMTTYDKDKNEEMMQFFDSFEVKK